ncbi:MAG: PAS domain S-box protein [Thermomicrobiales bacterium]
MASWPEPIIGTSFAGVIEVWNRAAEAFYGYSAQDALGQSITMLVPAGCGAELLDLLREVQHGAPMQRHRTQRRTRDGESLPWALTLSPVQDAAGALTGAMLTVQPDPAVAPESFLVEFERAFDESPECLVILSLEGRFLRSNQANCALLGYGEAELQQWTAADLIHPDDAAIEQAEALRVLEDPQRNYHRVLRVRRPDGRYQWVYVHATIRRDAAGLPLYFAGVGQQITGSERTTGALAAADGLALHTMLPNLAGAVVEVDASGRIAYANAVLEGVFGAPRSALLGSLFADVVPAGILARIQPALQASPLQEVDLPDVATPAGPRWCSIRHAVAGGFTLLFQDMAVVQGLEHDLRAARLSFEMLVEQLPAAVYYVWHAENRATIFQNSYVEGMMGGLADGARNWSLAEWAARVHPDDRDRTLEGFRSAAQRGKPLVQTYRFLRADGAYCWLQDTSTAMLDETGRPVGLLGFTIDITQQRDASEAISRLAAIVEASNDPIYSRDLQGIITFWNHAAEQLYGYVEAEIVGQPFTILEDPAYQPGSPVAPPGEPPSPERFQARHWRKDGSPVEVAVTRFPTFDAAGAVVGVSGILQDSTARLEAERALEAALEAAAAGERAKGRLVAVMSHELRTPLQAVLGYSEFLLSERLGPLAPAQREDVDAIQQGALRMARLIDQLLDYSRLEAGRAELVSEPLDLEHIVETVRQDVAPQAMARGLALVVDIPAGLPQAKGDPGWVRQILLNLAANAVKCTDVGSVRMQARQQGGSVEISVIDTGIGIPPEALPYIFDEFRQVAGVQSQRHGGAGLGLAISQQLAERMGGGITVQSVPGAGSTFTLRLPIPRPGDGPPPAAEIGRPSNEMV